MVIWSKFKNRDNNSTFFSKMTLTINSGDLWTGGLETVVTTVRWGILYMIHNPAIQHKIQQELNETIGQKPLELIHRQQTPYFHATIDELQRIVNVLPWNIPHALSKETVICGRRIKAGVTVMPQIVLIFWLYCNFYKLRDAFTLISICSPIPKTSSRPASSTIKANTNRPTTWYPLD